MNEDRIPPQNLAAEQSVIGAMLIDKNAITRAVEIVDGNSFYRDAHRCIFESILNLFEKNEPVDIVTVTDELRRNGKLESVGGSVYISDLLNSVPTAANVEYYARIVEEKAVLRSLIGIGTNLVADVFDNENKADDVLEAAERTIFDIALKRVRKGFYKIDTVLKGVLDKIEQVYGKKELLTGITSGYPDLDKLTSGFQNSDFIVIAARPSVGKTALALNIAQNAAIKHKVPVAIFSLEMSKDQLGYRLLCSESEIEGTKLRSANISDSGWKRLTKAIGRISEAPIFVDDSSWLTAIDMRAKARRLKMEHNIGLVIVDYLQMMQGRRNPENRVQEISDIARSLKNLAKELDVPVIALSQLSRAVEMRQSKKPFLSDLRESGEIEQSADLVIFIHRDDYYDPGTEKGNIAEIIIAKHRNGPTGQIELVFRKEFTKFESKIPYETAG